MKAINKKNKIIIKVTGGLGNQMFCYSMYRYWTLKGANVFFDIDDMILGMPPAKYGEPLPSFKLPIFFPNVVFRMTNYHEYGNDFDLSESFTALYLWKHKMFFDLINKIIKKIFLKQNRKNSSQKEIIYENPWDRGYYINGVNDDANFIVRGLFQMFQYTFMLRDTLIKEFAFTKKLPDFIEDIKLEIENHNSVSVHIRRNDYMLPYHYYSNGFVCTLQYYRNAVDYIKAHYPDACFYIFSDDVEWVKSNFDFLDNYFIVNTSSEGELSGYYDLFLMSKCKHNIIANSTFSWWGAFLNQNQKKLVLVPPKFSSEHFIATDEVCPPEWIRIPTTEQIYFPKKYIYNINKTDGV